MAPSHRFALALATSAVLGGLWMALSGATTGDDLGADLRPGVAEAPSERPRSATDLSAIPADERRRNGDLTRRATTDASGMYTLVGLYEGDYVLTLANKRIEKPLIIEVPAGGPVLEADPLVASDI